jgi:hypothetical protein
MEDLNDYAYPAIMAEKALKELHWSMLDKKPVEALEHGLNAMAWVAKLLEAVEYQRTHDR